MAEDPKLKTIGAGTLPFRGRTFERGRGCWNCIHWENGPLTRQRYRAARFVELARLRANSIPALDRLSAGDREGILLECIALTRRGLPAEEAVRQVLGEAALERVEEKRFAVFDALVSQGKIGMCLAGKPASDFVEDRYLCENGWTGRTGSSVATEGHPLDKTPGELREILDGPAPKDPKP